MSILLTIFDKTTNLLCKVDQATVDAAKAFENSLCENLKSKTELKNNLHASVARKLKIYDNLNRSVLSACALRKIHLNYFQKKQLRAAIDQNQLSLLPTELSAEKAILDLIEKGKIENCDIIKMLRDEAELPLNYRTKVRNSSLGPSLITSIFAEFVFRSVTEKLAKQYFLGWSLDDTEYFSYAANSTDKSFEQQNSLGIITVASENEVPKLHQRLEYLRSNLRNHSFITILISEAAFKSRSDFWHTIEKTILLAEKGFAENLPYRFIRKTELHSELSERENNSKQSAADLDLTFGACYYLDTFYIDNSKIEHSDAALLVFELNRYDETKIPCPVCHSKNVEGNSYSKLGVKSWECQNLLCKSRSRSNRGNRFSFYGALRQKSLENEADFLQSERIKAWNRDVVTSIDFNDAVEFAIDFYSVSGSKICWLSNLPIPQKICRTITCEDFNQTQTSQAAIQQYRLRYENLSYSQQTSQKEQLFHVGRHKVLHGDSTRLMASFEENTIDAAVTSPPYYNAREYSQWKNIYLYYADMKANAEQVFRVLKDDGVYLFNIFNYFDNENDIVKSAMGKKRLILSSVIVDIFCRIGFQFECNILWDKGHIEGKRGFNNGNFGPFHQQPFNCWEHILVFSKGCPKGRFVNNLPKVFQQKPHIKIVKGQNILGHTAPFPIELPSLITQNMRPNETIIDPYGGSGTTALAAEISGIKSIIVEANIDYVQLSKKRIEDLLNSKTLL